MSLHNSCGIMGGMKNWLKNIGVAILVVLIVTIFMVCLTQPIFRTAKTDPQLVSVYIAVGTFLLALATIMLAGASFLSIRENRRIREEERERDFKRRCLEDIQNWAEEVIELADKFWRGFRDMELFDRKLILKTKVINIESIGTEFSDDFRVRVEKAIKDFEAFDEEFKKEHWDSLQEKSERCKQSLINLLESVAYLKVELKL